MMDAERRKEVSTLTTTKVEAGFRDTNPKPGSNRTETRKKSTDKRGSQLPTIPLIEPIEETIEGKSLAMINQTELIQSDFEAWYRQYPKKVGKLQAEKAYGSIIRKKKATREDLLAGAKRYATERAGQDPRYTRHPTTWLNAGGWLDEPNPRFKTSDSILAGLEAYTKEH
jgi:hypothetical protein